MTELPRVLMIAYHFPPLSGSSGIQRTLRFAQHLPAFGWQPLVLTAAPRAYERTSTDLNADIPAGTLVRRAFALDTARHLAIRGRYVGAMARPDRWVSWRFDAVRQGLQMVREFKPQLIWSTYPIATAHMIGAALHRRTSLPWVADFRDPMAQDGYPADPKTWQSYKRIERQALELAALSVFTTPGAAAQYRQRYPAAAARIRVLENGYDEEAFASSARAHEGGPLNPGAVTLLHSGIVYPSERDPTQLMAALRRLHDCGAINPASLRIRFRAPVADALLLDLAQAHGVSGYIEVLPPVAYKAALAEMLRADALLVMQASNCNAQVPAKVYEYLRAGRPMLCLADPQGDTAGVIRGAGIDAIARLDDTADITQLLARFLAGGTQAPATLPLPASVQQASRKGRAQVLAGWLNTLKGGA
jgi:glycosyltransferase involved in cell wall biosynthesis